MRYVRESRLGLSQVRNTALRAAVSLGGSHILFLDDDEEADPDLLQAFVTCCRARPDAAILAGVCPGRFTEAFPRYIVNNRLFLNRNFFNDRCRGVFRRLMTAKNPTVGAAGVYLKHCGCGNVMLPLTVYAEAGIEFDPQFDRLGGEDADFFTRAREAGFRIIRCPQAVAWQIIDAERASVRWILHRRFAGGQAAAVRRFRERRSLPVRLWYITDKTVSAGLNAALTLLSVVCGPTVMLNSLGLMANNLGKVVGAVRPRPPRVYR